MISLGQVLLVLFLVVLFFGDIPGIIKKIGLSLKNIQDLSEKRKLPEKKD
jgi:Sec-independent protein translocase protein TatA